MAIPRLKQWYRYLVRAHHEGLRTHEAVLHLLRRIPCAGNLLDVGCGDGSKTMRYAAALGLANGYVYGIEQQPHYIAQAHKELRVVRVDLEREPFPFKDEEFDVIICNQVLEHLKNIFTPMREMARTLRAEGYLLIGIPNLASLLNRLLLLAGHEPTCNAIDGPHVRCFTTKGFMDFLRSNPDFEIVTVTGASLYPLPYPLVTHGATYCPSSAAYAFFLLRKTRHNQVQNRWGLAPETDTIF